jgi:hypothetical protein
MRTYGFRGKRPAKWMSEIVRLNVRYWARSLVPHRQLSSQNLRQQGQLQLSASAMTSRWRILAQVAFMALLSCKSGLKREFPRSMETPPHTVRVVPLICDSHDTGIFVAVHELPLSMALPWIPGLAVRMDTEFAKIFDDLSTHIEDWGSIPATAITQGEAYYIADRISTTHVAQSNDSDHSMQGRFRLPTLEESQCYTVPAPEIQSLCRSSNVWDRRTVGAYVHSLNAGRNAETNVAELNIPYVDCDDGYAILAPVGSGQADSNGLHHVWGNADEWLADTALVTGWSFNSGGMDDRDRPRYNGGGGFSLFTGMRVVFEPDRRQYSRSRRDALFR